MLTKNTVLAICIACLLPIYTTKPTADNSQNEKTYQLSMEEMLSFIESKIKNDPSFEKDLLPTLHTKEGLKLILDCVNNDNIDVFKMYNCDHPGIKNVDRDIVLFLDKHNKNKNTIMKAKHLFNRNFYSLDYLYNPKTYVPRQYSEQKCPDCEKDFNTFGNFLKSYTTNLYLLLKKHRMDLASMKSDSNH